MYGRALVSPARAQLLEERARIMRCSPTRSEERLWRRLSGSKTGFTYCDCTWTEFRTRFSAAELGDDGTVASDRFVAARVPVVKECGNKMPESVSKDAFMKGCAKAEAAEKLCGCPWKELRKHASPAEIESGTFDQKSVFGQVEKSGGKLRPPKGNP